jgi:hypothetical protein
MHPFCFACSAPFCFRYYPEVVGYFHKRRRKKENLLNITYPRISYFFWAEIKFPATREPLSSHSSLCRAFNGIVVFPFVGAVFVFIWIHVAGFIVLFDEMCCLLGARGRGANAVEIRTMGLYDRLATHLREHTHYTAAGNRLGIARGLLLCHHPIRCAARQPNKAGI